jgi:TetR/AcrR family transcriptional regulator
VSRALLYLYFPDRNALHFAVCERALKLLGERFAEAVSRHARGLDQVESIGRAYLAFSLEFPLYFKMLSRFESHPADQIEPNSSEALCVMAGDTVHTITSNAVRLGIQDGSIRADIGDPFLVAVSLWGMMHGVIQLSMTKANLLAHDGITSQQLLYKALEMCGRALRSSVAATGN